MENVRDRVATVAGIASPAAVLVTVAGATVASPSFTLSSGKPFSVMGAAGEPTATLFNAGLLLAGLLALPFAARLWRRWSRPVGGLYALAGLGLVGAGLFPMGSGLHDVATGFFASLFLLLVVAAVGDWRAGERRAAVASLALAAAIPLAWDVLPLVTSAEMTIPELVNFLVFGVWSAWTVRRTADGRTRRTTGANVSVPAEEP